jgi:type VI secretion system secreted protein Hcp
MFIKFEGVDGEAQDKSYRGWCNALSFSQGQSLQDSVTGATRRRGNVVFEDIVVVKELDKASPKLAEAVCKGKVFPKVEIHLTRSNTNTGLVTYYTYELNNVLIVGYRIGGGGYSENIPTEEISLSFEEIKVTYTETDERGVPRGNVVYEWRVEEGVI